MKRALPLIALLLATCAIATPDPARVERLTRELSQQRPRRIQALWELYRMGPNAKSATPALLKALYNEELEDVPLVMSALVAIAPEDLNVVRELSERTKYDTTAIRLRAEYLLSKVAARPSKARDTLFLAFGRDRALSQLLLDLGPAPAPDLFSKMLRMPTEEHGAWLNLFRVYGQQPYAPEVTDMLVTQMASKDPKRVDLAVTILQQFGQQSEGAVTALNAYVVSTDTPERTILGCTTLATRRCNGRARNRQSLASGQREHAVAARLYSRVYGPRSLALLRARFGRSPRNPAAASCGCAFNPPSTRSLDRTTRWISA